MRHLPIFIDLQDARVALAGGGAVARAKLGLLLRCPARVTVFAPRPDPEIVALAEAGRVALVRRSFTAADCAEGWRLAYAASGVAAEDRRVAALARAAGILTNAVDNLEVSDFITPAIVDRDPVVVAIGTGGAAPVLARRIKAGLEAALPAGLGALARAAADFRSQVASILPGGRARRMFWASFFDRDGPRALAAGGAAALPRALADLARRQAQGRTLRGHVDLVGAGPGDPALLTMAARHALDRADVVIHDRLVSAEILDLARREALVIPAGKEGHGPAVAQAEINRLMVRHARAGAHVVRLKGGDPTVFGRLEEEIDALEAGGISWQVIPGITAASAAAAALGRGLTARGRNAGLRLLTGHDTAGFAEQDWQALARPGAVAAFYMARRAARFIQGRLLMHGAAGHTPICLVADAARPGQRIVATTLANLPGAFADPSGPIVLLYGVAPRAARSSMNALKEALP